MDKNKVKFVNRIIVVVFVIVAIVTALHLYISSRIPKIPEPKSINIDAEKVGKTLGDLKRDFLKGYRDSTSVKTDSIK
jgi:cell division protein YceG involved in septum cleavage